MLPISSSNNVVALRLVEQIGVRQPAENNDGQDRSTSMIAVSQGLSIESASSGTSQNARHRISESVFDASHIDVTEQKMKLFTDVGEALDIREDDFDTPLAYATALRIKVNELLEDETGLGREQIRTIEKDLGLDELGFTLEDVINAIANPDGESDEKLYDALDEKYNGPEEQKETEDASEDLSRKLDEFGRYDAFF
ncbi:hypothetical protein [Notoacmeibacter ruber]|uniref:Uncharacterized protein n=1 Tax=Notoacmeibacter ruber TaxID=2670375 RepID=A0A3L7JCQ9_9HYPH|nr:hypothetical protein [Notoacmeibacter ruber]RLQ88453.1 hypothetical protein D8780_09780 [Notoacmeibacter ruber]